MISKSRSGFRRIKKYTTSTIGRALLLVSMLVAASALPAADNINKKVASIHSFSCNFMYFSNNIKCISFAVALDSKSKS